MGLFKKKADKEKDSKKLSPKLEYVPEELLHAFFVQLGMGMRKIDAQKYVFDERKFDNAHLDIGIKFHDEFKFPTGEFSTVAEMIEVLMPVFDEVVLKPCEETFVSESSYTYENMIENWYDTFADGNEELLKVLNEYRSYFEIFDFVVNKGQHIDLEKFYQKYYGERDLIAELKKLRSGEEFTLYNFNDDPDEMVEIRAFEIKNLVKNSYIIDFYHSFNRNPKDKWKGCLVGTVVGVVPLDGVHAALESLKDDNTELENSYYKGDKDGKYPISELKSWLQTSDDTESLSNLMKVMDNLFKPENSEE